MVYVVLDGPDGGGKSTQATSLANHVRGLGRTVAHLREPGSTPVGEALRTLLLDAATGELTPLTEALLFTAARAELAHRVIAPALQRGEVVIVERCYVSTLVYQCIAAEPALDHDWVLDATRRAHGAVLPSRVFLLDVPFEVAAARRGRRDPDRFERRDDAFHRRVREAYLQVAARDPVVRVVDATPPFAEVQRELRRQLSELLS